MSAERLTATGTFRVRTQPHPGEARSHIGRLFRDKTWNGDLSGHGGGEMLSVRGDDASV